MAMTILVTGAAGFVGRNLVQNLKAVRDGKTARARSFKSAKFMNMI